MILELVDVAASESDTRSAAGFQVPRDLPDLARFLITLGGGARGPEVPLLDGIHLAIEQPSVVAIVGVAGSGKSSLVRVLARELVPVRGAVLLEGIDVFDVRGKQEREVQRKLQIVLDDELGGLDPRMTVADTFSRFARTLRITPDADAVARALATLRLHTDVLARRVEQLTHGEAKRAAIARALTADPRVVVMDEPTRGLDPIDRGVLIDVVRAPGNARVWMCATRDIAFARATADHVVVLDQGAVVEQGPREQVLSHPTHPRTVALLAAEPRARTRSSTPG
jgi:ABC-type glutathione transport system ATPase component